MIIFIKSSKFYNTICVIAFASVCCQLYSDTHNTVYTQICVYSKEWVHRKLLLSIPNTRYSTKPRINEKPRTSAGDIGTLTRLAWNKWQKWTKIDT